MFFSLFRGKSMSLKKDNPDLKKIKIGLGWDARKTDGEDFDLDASALMLDSKDKSLSDRGFIFYNNPKSADGSIVHSGDNRTGDGDGDDETILVDLEKVPANVDKILAIVSIHDAEVRRQNFGMVSSANIHITNAENGAEIAKYDLSEEGGGETAMIFGELYRYNGEWKFKAVGQGFAGGLRELLNSYGAKAEY